MLILLGSALAAQGLDADAGRPWPIVELVQREANLPRRYVELRVRLPEEAPAEPQVHVSTRSSMIVVGREVSSDGEWTTLVSQRGECGFGLGVSLLAPGMGRASALPGGTFTKPMRCVVFGSVGDAEFAIPSAVLPREPCDTRPPAAEGAGFRYDGEPWLAQEGLVLAGAELEVDVRRSGDSRLVLFGARPSASGPFVGKLVMRFSAEWEVAEAPALLLFMSDGTRTDQPPSIARHHVVLVDPAGLEEGVLRCEVKMYGASWGGYWAHGAFEVPIPE